MTAQPSSLILHGGWQSGQQRRSDAYHTRRRSMTAQDNAATVRALNEAYNRRDWDGAIPALR